MGFWSWFWILVPPAVFLIATVAYYTISNKGDGLDGG